MVSPYPPSKVTKNVREVVVPEGAIETMSTNVFASKVAGPMTVTLASITKCPDTLGAASVQALLKEQFDVVLLTTFLAPCFISLVYQLQVCYSLIVVL